MKLNIVLAILVVLVSYLTCKNLQKTAVTPAAAPEQQVEDYSTGGFNWKASHVIQGSNPDSAGTYQVQQAPARVKVPWETITPPTTSRRSFMSTGWWIAKMAYQPSDTLVHHHYMPRYLKFHEDQTFDILQNGTVLETGHWAYDDPNKVLYISCKDTYYNNTWKIHENGFRMVWLGNTDLNVTGIQIRMDGSKTDPSIK